LKATLWQRLRATVEALAIPHAGSTVGPVLTVTVGVVCGRAGRSVGELLHEAAELAMTAKLDGRRNRVIDA
jgi:PleD family two-component response regulator